MSLPDSYGWVAHCAPTPFETMVASNRVDGEIENSAAAIKGRHAWGLYCGVNPRTRGRPRVNASTPRCHRRAAYIQGPTKPKRWRATGSRTSVGLHLHGL